METPEISRERPVRSELSGNVKATREDWLEAALATLISSGVGNVRILTLGRHLGVSRSSFYWYFASRQDLLNQLLELWRSRNTRFIVERAARPAPSITQAVLNIFECWVDNRLFDAQLEFAVRAWARLSADVRTVIDDADFERVDAIHRMFLRHGYPAPDAFVRARILYFMQIGYYSLEIMETMESRLALVPAYIRSFTGRDPEDGEIEAFNKFAEELHAQP